MVTLARTKSSASSRAMDRDPNLIMRNLPNALTSITVLCGFYLIVAAPTEVDRLRCVYAVMLGLVTDILDGLAARHLNVKSAFGASFDQLADLVCFGIGPGIFYTNVCSISLGGDGENAGSHWLILISGFGYVLCSVIRIARALIVHHGARPTHFIGIPTNLASFILVPVVGYCPTWRWLPLMVIVLSGLMVADVKIPKGLGIVKTE